MPIKDHIIAMERYTRVKEENSSPFFYLFLFTFYCIIFIL